MAQPDLSNIDLSVASPAAPDIANVDLSGGSETGAIGSAALSLSALGTGFVAPTGIGSASVSITVAGVGSFSEGAAGAAELIISGGGYAESGYFGSGEISLDFLAAGVGYQDWVSQLPPLELQEVYRLVLTGAEDSLDDLLIGGISSWQATNQADGRSSYLQAVIPAADEILSEIEARQNGQIVIQKGYRLSNGEARYEEILRARFDNLRPDRGQRALTVTVSGYLPGKAASSGRRALSGIRSISVQNGKRRVRCDIDLFLQPGMTVDALEDTFRAGFINYYVSQTDKFCEVGER